jgi:hypothetical protein
VHGVPKHNNAALPFEMFQLRTVPLLKQDPRARLMTEDLVDFLGQLEIEIADSLHAVRVQIDDHFIPDVAPFGMVVHPFGDQGHLRHFPERGYEILALECLVQLAVLNRPTVYGMQSLLNILVA